MSDPPINLHIFWEEKQPLPEVKAGTVSSVFGRDLLVAGGTNWNGNTKRWLDHVDLYDFESNQWRTGPHLPGPSAYGCFAVTQAGFEIIGGCDSTGGHRASWVLQPGCSEWHRLQDAPQNFVFAAAENWSENLYLFGGCTNDSDLTTASGAVWMRDSNHAWQYISDLPRRDVLMSAHACVRDKVYLFGGCSVSPSGDVINHDDAFSFDCNTYEWTRLRRLPSAVRGASAVALDNGWIVILGGYGTDFLNTVLIYDTESDRYQEKTPLPVGLLGVHFALYDGVIYSAGGEHRMRGRLSKLFAGSLGRSTSNRS